METQTEIKVKTGYEYLREMCSFNADFNAFTPRVNPTTNRVAYIKYQLEKMNVPFDVDIFNAENPEMLNMSQPKFVNICVFFKGNNPSNETIIFLAHHDVVKIEYENCEDNTASVCNLLHLCGILKDKKLDKNILVVFTDAEEKCEFTKCGAKRLAIMSKLGMFGNVSKAINLELTANGECLWISTDNSVNLALDISAEYNGQIVHTPYNDSVVLEQNKMTSVCIGTLTENELHIAMQHGYCKTWALCHKADDTIANANASDMQSFVENVLVKMTKV